MNLTKSANQALVLYKYLLRQCERLPSGPREHYKFMIRQSYKQHVKENDQERISQILKRAYEDADWVLKKVPSELVMLVPLAISGSTVPLHNFWNALHLYLECAHVVNRKLAGTSNVHLYEVDYDSPSNKLTDIINHTSLTYETSKLAELTSTTLDGLVLSLLLPYDKNVQLSSVKYERLRSSECGTFVVVRVLYASNPSCSNCVELVLFDKKQNSATFVTGADKNKYKLIAPPFPYTFSWKGGVVKLVIDIEDAESSSAEWLEEKLFTKLIKWAEEYDEERVKRRSLELVSIERYCALYKEMKARYGDKMVKIWPENTDPLKFVYEDIAIACYLMCLWERTDARRKPSFVDLGCGNGLLVYILSEEGYPGYGIDVRRRKIWDLYPETVKLEVKTIIPLEFSVMPVDWIIGNHSDELTPWIPILASRSSPTTNFFVLPCCAYELNGRKYARKDPSRSQYSEYLDYVQQICCRIGFKVHVDKLRIPSTKRTCIVSTGRTYAPTEFPKIDAEITEMIQSKCQHFEARAPTERVRNCTQIDREVVATIVRKVVNELLQDGKIIRGWNVGRELQLSHLISTLDREDLARLKNECGGLQTLLKNHRYIFEVSNGVVKLRVPPLVKDVQKYKDKPCWFLSNHPDGCLNGNDCAYHH